MMFGDIDWQRSLGPFTLDICGGGWANAGFGVRLVKPGGGLDSFFSVYFLVWCVSVFYERAKAGE